eukprot:PhM_4_TR18013/c0_g1_i4/m.33386
MGNLQSLVDGAGGVVVSSVVEYTDPEKSHHLEEVCSTLRALMRKNVSYQTQFFVVAQRATWGGDWVLSRALSRAERAKDWKAEVVAMRQSDAAKNSVVQTRLERKMEKQMLREAERELTGVETLNVKGAVVLQPDEIAAAAVRRDPLASKAAQRKEYRANKSKPVDKTKKGKQSKWGNDGLGEPC